jgi:sulfide:quinone oxidoreductase
MRVLVAGGGIAALEVLAGLRTLAGERVQATLLAPDRAFSYSPLSTAVPFTFRTERTRPLDGLAGGLGANFVPDGLAQVDEARGRVLTQKGDFLPYEVLVLAVGARVEHGGPATFWQRGPAGQAQLARLLHELEAGTTRSVAFVVPHRAGWPVDAYELALVASVAARRGAAGTKVSVLTAETAPLEAFGAAAAEAVRTELARAEVELVTGVEVSVPEARDEAGRDAFSSTVARLAGRARRPESHTQLVLRLRPGSSVAVDRALFLPAVHGPAIAGTAHDPSGFIPVDEHARASGQNDVYAAGDATALALKHSTSASAQGTAAAEAIAAAAGADVDPQPWRPMLYGILALPPHFPGPPGSPWLRNGEPVTHCLWWPPGHVAGRHLAPYLASSDPAVSPGLEWHPDGVPLAIPVRQYSGTAVTAPPASPEAALRQDAMTRQLMAIRRTGHAAERLEQVLERRGKEFDLHAREVISQLRAAGYLRES